MWHHPAKLDQGTNSNSSEADSASSQEHSYCIFYNSAKLTKNSFLIILTHILHKINVYEKHFEMYLMVLFLMLRLLKKTKCAEQRNWLTFCSVNCIILFSEWHGHLLENVSYEMFYNTLISASQLPAILLNSQRVLTLEPSR